MQYIALAILLYWFIRGADLIIGVLFRIPVLKNSLVEPKNFPKVSLIFAAKNEAPRVGEAVKSMLAQDYPSFEVIAVNDRSDDNTLEILKAVQDERLKVLNVEKLPEGWLGKTHALFSGFQISSGEWLLFTDADILMKPGTVRAAISAAVEKKLDHMTLLPELILGQFIEVLFTSYFALAFNMRYRPWAAQNPKSLAYAGVGAFNLVRRDVYEKVGTHKVLALDIADDMIFGRVVKRAGFRQMVLFGNEFIAVRWVEGFKGVLNSLHKNAFRGLNYSFMNLVGATIALAAVDIFPFVMIFFGRGNTFYFSVGAALSCFCVYLAGQKYNRKSIQAFVFHPATCLFFLFILWRSALTALIQGGVRWRDTFYSLKELRRGMK